jgi:hypothetical protein
MGDRSERIVKVVPAGYLDLEILEEAELTLESTWSPDSLESCCLSISTLGGTSMAIWPPMFAPLHELGVSLDRPEYLLWYAAQWACDNADEGAPDAHAAVSLADIVEHIEHPAVLRWMRERTQDVLEACDELDPPSDVLDLARRNLSDDVAAVAQALEP